MIWEVGGFVGDVHDAFLPEGTTSNPSNVFGDGSGGADTAEVRLRRVAVGIVVVENDIEIVGHITGPLSGLKQPVPRGELKALWLTATEFRGYAIFATDCENVYKGWRAQIYLTPNGKDSDLRAMICQFVEGKSVDLIQAAFINSHFGAEDLCDGQVQGWMILGSTVIDELVGTKATETRVSAEVRHRA